MTVPGSDTRVSGSVIWGNGFARPIGYLHYGCPADPTEEDEDLCRRWSGIVYALDGGVVSLLPEEADAPAPDQLILANLGQAIRYSGLIEALATEIPDLPMGRVQLQGLSAVTQGIPTVRRLISGPSIRGIIMRSLSALALVSVLISQAAAAECALSDATYTQDDTSFVLQFRPRTSETAATTTSLFTLTAPVAAGTTDFSGEVIWGNGISVPGGFLTKDCPADAFTIEELEPCTYWEGVMYAVGGDEAQFLADDETTPAPKGLLLPDLGRSMHYSSIEVEEVPGDFFKLAGCKK
jgi:hypothetical protein